MLGPMKSLLRLVSFGALVLATASCRAPQSDYRPTSTLKDIMDSMIDPSADDIWNSVATVVTIAGTEERAPSTDDEWKAVRRAAVTLLEATNLVVMPGRHVARAHEKSENPGVELEPEQMEALITQNREAFVTLAHGLHDSTLEALKAVDEKNVKNLFDAGEHIDTACENCHQRYWYPPGAKKP